jgi:hypothetical protein
MGTETPYFSHYVIHSTLAGKIASMRKSDKLKEAILYEHYNVGVGDNVEVFQSSANRLGVLLLKYTDESTMLDLIYHMDENLVFDIEA